MKYLYTLLLAAAVTPAFAQTAPAAKSSLNYNRVAVGYSSDDSLKGYNVTASALLGGAVIVSGIYDDVDAKGDAAGLNGKLSGFGLAYKFNVGPGDLAIGYAYKTGTIYGDFDNYSASGLASAEQKGFSINYRQAINNQIEFSVGYSRLDTLIGLIATNGSIVGADSIDSTTNSYNIGLRYNITKNLDLSLNYAFQNENAGGDKFGVSVGYNF
jgi:hypothetical protein